MTTTLVYIAGPYRNADPWLCEQNIRAAEALAYRVGQLGAYPVCPHTNTRPLFESAQANPEFWLEGTLQLMRRCDAVVFLPSWRSSSGAREERAEAERRLLPIFDVGDLDDGTFTAWLRGRG